MSSLHSIIATVTRFFFLSKNTKKKKQRKEHETDCDKLREHDDENKVPDLSWTKLVLCFSFSFSDLKPSIIYLGGAECSMSRKIEREIGEIVIILDRELWEGVLFGRSMLILFITALIKCEERCFSLLQ